MVAAGVVGLALTAMIFGPRRRAVREQTVVRDAPVVQERTYREDV